LPLYEYECKKCGKRVEKIQKFSDPPITKCERCGGELERLVSSPAIQFKGSGWYITDYARKSSSATNPSAEKPSDAGQKTEKAKVEEKPKTSTPKD
jgi:putative FmdB family regulatory protein